MPVFAYFCASGTNPGPGNKLPGTTTLGISAPRGFLVATNGGHLDRVIANQLEIMKGKDPDNVPTPGKAGRRTRESLAWTCEDNMRHDGTGAPTGAADGGPGNGQGKNAWPEGGPRSHGKENGPWTYLYTHHNRIMLVNGILRERFPTFIHTTTVYSKVKNRIRHEERPTISNLIFVHGEEFPVRGFLSERLPGTHLARDCSTGKVATISDSAMQAFMRVSEIDPSSLRFMPNAIEHYAGGNDLVRITSGILRGFEGYIVRIARDRCLVTSLGGLTVSISGIHGETYEKVG